MLYGAETGSQKAVPRGRVALASDTCCFCSQHHFFFYKPEPQFHI